jgi:hypothetical protein
MIKDARPHLLVALTLLLMPPPVSGNATTARVTITGGGLTRPIQITDAKVLEASNAWGEEFLDASRPPLTQFPNVGGPYEVAFYSGSPTDMSKTCVFFYSPSDSVAGVIYLPGKGALWVLNAGTVVRQGRDGKWSYASLSGKH